MKTFTITVSATNDWITIDGVPHRMWDGQTSSGIPIQAAIARVAPIGGPNEEFRKECSLAGLRPPAHPVSAAQIIEDVNSPRFKFHPNPIEDISTSEQKLPDDAVECWLTCGCKCPAWVKRSVASHSSMRCQKHSPPSNTRLFPIARIGNVVKVD